MTAIPVANPAMPRLDTLRPTPFPHVPAMLDKSALLAGLRGAKPCAPSLTTPAFDVRAFGAKGDGETIDTTSIQNAVDAAHAAGGGVVYAGPGVYMMGGVELKNNVTLHLEAGAYLWSVAKQADFVHPRGHMVFALGASNIALRGRGTIYGNAEAIMDFPPEGTWCSDRRMPKNLVSETSVNPPAPDWRPERCLYFDHCTDLLIEDVTVRDTPEWAVHLRRSSRVRVTGLKIINGLTCRVDKVANNDALDIDTCTNVTVSDCLIQSSDDAICLKIEDFGEKTPTLCRDIVITNCVTRTTQTAIKLGTGSCGEYRNICISNCTVQDGAGGIGMWIRDGGLIDGVRIDNITICQESDREQGTAFYFRGYRRNAETPREGRIRNVAITNVTANSHGALFMAGGAEGIFEDISFQNIRFTLHGQCPRQCAVTPPEPFHPYAMNQTPYELYVNHARNLSFRDVSFRWDSTPNANWTHAMRFLDVKGLLIDDFCGKQGGDAAIPAILLRDVTDAWIRHSRASEGCGPFVVVGGKSRNIMLTHNDLSRAASAFQLLDGVPESECHLDGNLLPV